MTSPPDIIAIQEAQFATITNTITKQRNDIATFIECLPLVTRMISGDNILACAMAQALGEEKNPNNIMCSNASTTQIVSKFIEALPSVIKVATGNNNLASALAQAIEEKHICI